MTGRAQVLTAVGLLAEAAQAQEMVLTRAQLSALGITWWAVDDHLRAQRWREVCSNVLVLHRGPITPRALSWIAVLAGGEVAALCSYTALTLHGLRGWERPPIHLVIPRGHKVHCPDGIVIHESRRHGLDDIARHHGLPTHRVARAAIDAAAWSDNLRTGCGLLAACVQQGLATPGALREALEAAGRIRHRRALMAALQDISGGAQALSEIDFARLCRAAGLPEPTRQRVRRDVQGRRRYLDVEWRLPDGRTLSVEVDGIGHLEAERWYDDLWRQAELDVPQGHQLIRLPARAVRLEPERVIAVLRRAFRAVA